MLKLDFSINAVKKKRERKTWQFIVLIQNTKDLI